MGEGGRGGNGVFGRLRDGRECDEAAVGALARTGSLPSTLVKSWNTLWLVRTAFCGQLRRFAVQITRFARQTAGAASSSREPRDSGFH